MGTVSQVTCLEMTNYEGQLRDHLFWPTNTIILLFNSLDYNICIDLQKHQKTIGYNNENKFR